MGYWSSIVTDAAERNQGDKDRKCCCLYVLDFMDYFSKWVIHLTEPYGDHSGVYTDRKCIQPIWVTVTTTCTFRPGYGIYESPVRSLHAAAWNL